MHKDYFVPLMITRKEIADVLLRWQAGLLTAQQVHEWAEELYFPGCLDFDDEEGGECGDDNSVANEVMSALDKLDMDLMLVEDVPIYLEFLETPPGQFLTGYQKCEQTLAQIDRRRRQRDLAEIALYAPFCKECGSGEV
jgi:hypothetical protein